MLLDFRDNGFLLVCLWYGYGVMACLRLSWFDFAHHDYTTMTCIWVLEYIFLNYCSVIDAL